jgi:spore germination protein
MRWQLLARSVVSLALVAALAAAGAPARAGSVPLLAYWSVWGDPGPALADLRAHLGEIAWIAPYGYALEADGSLVPRGVVPAVLGRLAAAARVPVLPLVTDGPGLAALLATAPGRAQAAAALADLCRGAQGAGGVVVDFEGLPASARADLTAFVAALRAALPRGRLLVVAVMPKTSTPGRYAFQRVFDYRALGRLADFVALMTYDRHDDTSGPGPVAPLGWVARVAAFAASEIPPRKILLGIPGYGYDWTAPGEAVTVDAREALALAREHGVVPVYDARVAESGFRYVDAQGVRHTVWFEPAAGVAAKRQLAARLGLGGLALWSLGQEDPSFWPAAGA